MRAFRFWTSVLPWAAVFSVLLGFAGIANATPSQTHPDDFTLSLATRDIGRANVTPEFGRVLNFAFELDFSGPLAGGQFYSNRQLEEVRYIVSGGLSTNPPTPSGFPGFALNRFENGEGPISKSDWESQRSHLAFALARDIQLGDGVQLSELTPFGKDNRILEINAREQGRLDVSRYHPPQLILYADGTGLLWNANNKSKDTGTINPATGLKVNVDFGEEYISRLRFDPSAITIIDAPNTPPVPEPGTALLLALGLAGLSRRRKLSS